MLRSYLASTASVAGDFPNRRRRAPLCDVIIASTQTEISEKLLPELNVAGADLERIHLLSRIDGAEFNAALERPRLATAADTLDEDVLVLVDLTTEAQSAAAIAANLSSTFNELKALAREIFNPVVVFLTAFNIRDLDRLLKTAELLASLPALNSVSLVTRENRFAKWLFVPVKNLVGHDARCLGFSIKSKSGRRGAPVATLEWSDKPVLPTTTQFLVAGDGPGRTPRKIAAAEEFLRQQIAAGPRAKEKLAAEANQVGISNRSLTHARNNLGIEADVVEVNGKRQEMWKLP